jgi:hypothetical protein
MVAPRNLTGEIFGRLTVVARNPQSTKAGKARWDCVCECGNTCTVIGAGLIIGDTQSCGCIHKEQLVERSYKHGSAARNNKTPEYRSWCAMLSRCTNPNFHKYQAYGGVGVTVCDRWHNFENFLSDMGPRPQGTSIDRIDPWGNYEPSNCRWADAITQANNKRA